MIGRLVGLLPGIFCPPHFLSLNWDRQRACWCRAANVTAEFEDIVEAAALAESVKHPWKNIMQPRYRPQFITAVLIPFFQQFTGADPAESQFRKPSTTQPDPFSISRRMIGKCNLS